MRRLLHFGLIVGLTLSLGGGLVPALLIAADPIPGIGPVGDVVKLRGGFQFTEGPVAAGEDTLYFTDIPANRIYKVTFKPDAEPEFEVFLEPSGHANGLMLGDSKLLVCQMDGQVAAVNVDTRAVTPMLTTHDGKRFNAPNDLTLDEVGGFYFTDPAFSAPTPLPQGVTAVYYAAKDGTTTRLVDDLQNPNGCMLSPDGKTLYVIPSGSKTMMSYPVESPGKLGPGQKFCDLLQAKETDNGGGDGCTIDTQGNLYITTGLGIQIFDPVGKHLGTIAFPEQPANCTFGGPGKKTLFASCRTGLYKIETEATGAR